MSLDVDNEGVSVDDGDVCVTVSVTGRHDVYFSVSDVLDECRESTLLERCDPDTIREWCRDHNITLDGGAPDGVSVRAYLRGCDDAALLNALAEIVARLTRERAAG